MDYVTLIAAVLEQVLGLAASATSGQASNIIGILEKVVPVAVEAEKALLVPIQNIIAALRGSGAVTADQVAALKVQSDAIDAALDAAAEADGLDG